MESVMRGDFSQPPPQASNIVRIFLSSTFGDFTAERNRLSRETFPHLQRHCQALGLEFQVVDMRWGVRDENISYHQTSEVCIQEIHNCQRLSLGPSCLALIGDRYGYRPFPGKIPFEEFQTFIELGLAYGVCTRILLTWYKLDHNTVVKAFQLLPITLHYPNYSSKDEELRKIDRDGWWQSFLTLQKTFWSLVKVAVSEGRMSEERAHIYLQSVTEDEIDHGIFRASSPETSCLCYTRTLSNLHDNLQDDLVSRYTDVIPDSTPCSVDAEAQALLQQLKHKKLPQALKSGSNFHAYSIPWVPGGLNEEVLAHNSYLDQLCKQVLVDVKSLVDRAIKARTNLYSALQSEVLHHALLCKNKCESYCDRRDGVITKIHEYIVKSAPHPLVIHGRSGSGKTSVMAKAAVCMQDWIASFSVVRFLGTSPQSTTIREVLVSVSEQVCSIYGFSLPSFSRMDTIDIIRYFRNELLLSVEKSPNGILIIMLDSIDQLSPVEGAHSMKWLPFFLPPNVRIVISMLSDKCDCLKNVQAILPPTEDSYVELGSMCIEAGMEIMDVWLSEIGRSLTAEQRTGVVEAFLSCPQPLFLKLIFGQARTWQSYLDKSSLVISNSVQEALSHLYRHLEVQFGEVLVQKSLGYLTAAKSGLTEAELEDVLSLDNEVLNDTYQYWDPPVKGVVRIPSLVWKRIRHFITDYIVEQQADGKTVLMWYHRQFIESASFRYVKGGTVKESLHFTLSQFFEGTWGNGVGKSITLKHRNLILKHANRQVPTQPLKFGDSMYNYRKLSELPHHLLHSSQINELKSKVLCHFDWIHSKLKAFGFAGTVQDYLSTLEVCKDEAVSIVCETLSLSSSNLKSDPDSLAGQLLGRLLSIQPTSSICQLLDETQKWVKQARECVFQPLNDCLISPGGELKVTVAGHPQVILGIATSESLPFLVSYSKGPGCDVYNVWDLTSLECIENVSTLKLHGDSSLQAFNHFLTGFHLVAINLHSYALWNIKTGECIEHIERFDGDAELSCLAATGDCQSILVGTNTGHVYFINRLTTPQEKTTLKFEGAIKSIHVTPDTKLSLIISGKCNIAVADNQSKLIITSTPFDLGANFSVVHTATSSEGVAYLIGGTTAGSVCFSQCPNLSFTVMEGHGKAIKCVTHIASLNLVITGSLDKTMCVWDIHQCSIIRRLEGHMDGVWCLDSLPNSSKVVSGSKDDYLKVWDVLSGSCLHTLEGHSSWISSVKAVSSELVVSGSNDKTLKFWKVEHGKVRNTKSSSNRHTAQPECIALSCDGLAASGGPDAVKVWNPLNGDCLCSLPASVSCLVFTCNGKNLIAGTKSGTIKVFDAIDNFSQIKVLEKHQGKVSCLLALDELSGSVLVSASLDSTLVVWSDHYKCTVLSGHTAGVTSVTSSQDKQTVASGSQQGDILVWNLSHSRCLGTLRGHSKTVNCMAFNADCTRLVSGSDDKAARVWNTLTMNCLSIITYSDSIKALCFTDLEVFVAGAHCSREQLRSWNTETGECLMHYVGHTHAVMCMLLVDGNTILTGSRDGTVRVWSSKTSEMLASFDLQSQVKHVTVLNTPTGEYLLAATTKSGPIAFLKFNMNMYHP